MKTASLPFGAKRCLSFRFYCSALKSFLLWWWCLWCQRFPGRRKDISLFFPSRSSLRNHSDLVGAAIVYCVLDAEASFIGAGRLWVSFSSSSSSF